MRRTWALFAALIFTSRGAIGQVHIRESMTINPGRATKAQVNRGEDTLKFVIRWMTDSGTEPPGPESVCLEVIDPAGKVTRYESGPISLGSWGGEDTVTVAPQTAGTYAFRVSIFKTNTYRSETDFIVYEYSGGDTLELFPAGEFSWVDAYEWAHFSAPWRTADGIAVNDWNYFYYYGIRNTDGYPDLVPFTYTTPYYSKFRTVFSDSNLFYRGHAYAGLSGVYDSSSTRWYPSDDSPVTYRIISGGQFASFHSTDPAAGLDEKLGWVVRTDTLDEYRLSNFCLAADSVRADSTGNWVVVQASSDGMTAVDSILALPYEYPVLVSFDPPELSPGDTADIVLRRVNIDGTVTDFPPDQQFEVGITEGDSNGTILAPNDMTTGDYFSYVYQGFKFSGAGNYILTGSTASHPDNHYLISQNAVNDLIPAANDFQRKKWNTTGMMRLNDMSLPWGGLFDFEQYWSEPHHLHRIGKSVDIENIVTKDTTVTFTENGQEVTKTVPVADEDWLKKFVDMMRKYYGWDFQNEGQTIPNSEGRVKYPHFEWKGN